MNLTRVGSGRTLRSCSWGCPPSLMRAAFRLALGPSDRGDILGLRLMRRVS